MIYRDSNLVQLDISNRSLVPPRVDSRSVYLIALSGKLEIWESLETQSPWLLQSRVDLKGF